VVWWRACLFLAVFAILQCGWQALEGTDVHRFLVQVATVKSAVAVINWVTPTVHAQASATLIRASGGGIRIVNGCDGTEALFLLLGAFAVAPLPVRSRLWGMLYGLPFVFAVNEGRVLGLFYAHRSNQGLFDVLHGTVTPVAVILLVSGYFYVWLRLADRATNFAH
jgi:exosortase/archaeosortase family protein